MRLTPFAQEKLHYLKTGEKLDSELERSIRELEQIFGRHPSSEVFEFGFTERQLKNALREYFRRLLDIKDYTYKLQGRCEEQEDLDAPGSDLMFKIHRMTTEEMSEEHERLKKTILTLWSLWVKHKRHQADEITREENSLPFDQLFKSLDIEEDEEEIAAKVKKVI